MRQVYRGKFGTRDGYNMFEVASALQKSIRRGEVEEAMFWAAELDQSGLGEYLWKRLRIIASEDIGLADPMACVIVRSLYDNWTELRRKPQKSEREFIVHAVAHLCLAPKSRALDHLNMVSYTNVAERARDKEIPDHALDGHTQRGRRMGRGYDFFFTESTRLSHHKNDVGHPQMQQIASGKDPWADEAAKLKLAGIETEDKVMKRTQSSREDELPLEGTEE